MTNEQYDVVASLKSKINETEGMWTSVSLDQKGIEPVGDIHLTFGDKSKGKVRGGMGKYIISENGSYELVTKE
ncbi:hypothetical protein [Lederbergia lenta]|uniref:hypothetical protein n=1 Tax=Lederbergia lenta TaxID=1467 RepID=UPI00203D4B90|nr:hypothetical protein [Lederbergia lenta]MCM3109988.1 hypothetical protein [Lederbergia lenta]